MGGSIREYEADLADALRCFTEAIAIDPRHREAQLQRVRLLVREGQHAEAIDALVALAALGLDDLESRRTLAEELLKAEQFGPAVEAAERALELAPADAEARVCSARALRRLSKFEEAQRQWRLVLEDLEARKHFDFLDWELEAALVEERLDFEGGLRAFRLLLERSSERLLGLGDRAFASVVHDSEAAHRALIAFVDLRRTDRSVLARASQVWLFAKRADEAIEAAQWWVEVEPSSAQAWFRHAESLVAAGQLRQAIASYERAIVLWPDFLGATARLAVVRRQLDEQGGDDEVRSSRKAPEEAT